MTAIAQFRQRIRPEWIDYNGHLSEAYYVLVFGFATDALMKQVWLGEAYRARTRCSLYTVEAHIRYLREVPAGAELAITTRVIGSDAKKLRACHEMTVGGVLVATEEILGVHVDTEQGRGVPFPDHVSRRLGELEENAPAYAGRSVAL
ncbi:MAG: thioesterase [Pseudonocardiaceae bacterium]|nr:thioesterase [Pseudonocardiaceae bacterium]